MPQLRPQVPYSFPMFYNILSRYPAPSLFRLHDGAFYRTLRHEDGITLMKATSSGTVPIPILDVEWLVGPAPRQDVAGILGVQEHMHEFYDYAHANKPLWKFVHTLYGLPIDVSESVFQALMFVIIEQHISWVNAQKAQRVLVEWGNTYIEYEGFKYYVMPGVEQIANATIEDLKPLKITFKRMQMMIDIAQQVVDASLDLEGMLRLPPTEMYDELLKIKGVGHWTASVVVSRARGVFPYVPHNDVALQAATAEYFGIEKSAAATKAVFEKHSIYAGLVAHFTLMKWVLDKYPVVKA